MGLGFVGLTLATVMAEVGFRVEGVEIDPDTLASLRAGQPHFHEPGIERRFRRVVASGALRICSSIPNRTEDDVDAAGARTYVVTVGTPLDDRGRARLESVDQVARAIASDLADDDLVIMRSTVKVGTSRGLVAQILGTTGRRFGLAFCPERTLEGKALTELRELPQIVGGLDDASARRAMALFQCLTPTVVRVSDLETAELIKLVDNAQRDLMFAYANEVATICDALGVSAAEVIRCGKHGYARHNVPMPGPVGGPCLSKDPHILHQSVAGMGASTQLTVSGRLLNEALPARTAHQVGQLMADLPTLEGVAHPTITVMGLAFKGRPATDDLRGSTALPLIAALRARFPGATLRGFDAMVAGSEIEALGVIACDSVEAAFADSDVVVIANNHLCFEQMDVTSLAAHMGAGPSVRGLIYDLWNNFDARELDLPEGVTYVALGGVGLARRHLPAAENIAGETENIETIERTEKRAA